MTLIYRIIFFFFLNVIALWTAAYFVKDFEISSDFLNFATAAAIFALINIFIKPVLKLVLGPIIIITFGLGIILVNALALYILDIFSSGINIKGLLPLIYATLIIGAINVLISFSAKRLYKNND
ncbi:MAG: phage holin family protein [Patescibacteria group bacterium]